MASMMDKAKAIGALKMIGDMIVDSIRESDKNGLGAPGGTIYAALMAHGCTMEQFEAIMSALVEAGKLTRTGDLYKVAK